MEEIKINKNMKGQLEIMKALGIEPNYAELGREFDKDYRTVKKYYDGYEGKPPVKNKPSKLDEHYEEIKIKISLPGVTQMGLYQYIFKKDNEIGTYSNFKKYLAKHNLKPTKSSSVHPRFETAPGEQMQIDWKEDITMISKHGEIFQFNIFVSTLGYSRLHDFVYSRTKTREDVERCLMTTFKYIGGVSKHLLGDNMSTIADVKGTNKKVNKEFAQFAKDMGTSVKLCGIKKPETKRKR